MAPNNDIGAASFQWTSVFSKFMTFVLGVHRVPHCTISDALVRHCRGGCHRQLIKSAWGCGAFLGQFSRGNAKVSTILDGASSAQRHLDSSLVVSADIRIKFCDELLHVDTSPLSWIKELILQPEKNASEAALSDVHPLRDIERLSPASSRRFIQRGQR